MPIDKRRVIVNSVLMIRLAIWILIAGVAVVALWWLFESSWDRRLFAAEPGRVRQNLRVTEAKAWLQAHPETQVLDVRSARECAGGTLPGAVQLSIGDEAFEAKAGELDRSRPVLVYCAGGLRSRMAVEKLKALGFESILHLHRGYLSWSDP